MCVASAIVKSLVTLATLAVSVAVSLFLPASAFPAEPPAEIKVGMSAAFTGPSRGLGIELYRGAAACFAEVNSKGGIHGRPIVVRAYDDGYDPDRALANTVELIQRDKAFVLFGYVGTPTVTRVLPLLKRYSDRNVLLFCPFTGAEPMRQPPYGEFVFNLRASYLQETAGLVEHFVDIGRKRIGVFYQIDAYGRNGWQGVRLALEKRGLKMAGEATYRRGAQFSESMKAQVDLLANCHPDAIICVGSYAACAAFIRDARDAGLRVPIANVSFVGSKNLLALLLQYSEEKGQDYTVDLINSQVVPSYHRTDLEAAREYLALMKKHDPGPPPGLPRSDYQPFAASSVGFEGYLDARLLVEVLQRLGPDLDQGKLKETAEALRDWNPGIDISISFAPWDAALASRPGKLPYRPHQGLDKVYYATADKGRFVMLADWTRWQK